MMERRSGLLSLFGLGQPEEHNSPGFMRLTIQGKDSPSDLLGGIMRELFGACFYGNPGSLGFHGGISSAALSPGCADRVYKVTVLTADGLQTRLVGHVWPELPVNLSAEAALAITQWIRVKTDLQRSQARQQDLAKLLPEKAAECQRAESEQKFALWHAAKGQYYGRLGLSVRIVSEAGAVPLQYALMQGESKLTELDPAEGEALVDEARRLTDLRSELENLRQENNLLEPRIANEPERIEMLRQDVNRLLITGYPELYARVQSGEVVLVSDLRSGNWFFKERFLVDEPQPEVDPETLDQIRLHLKYRRDEIDPEDLELIMRTPGLLPEPEHDPMLSDESAAFLGAGFQKSAKPSAKRKPAGKRGSKKR